MRLFWLLRESRSISDRVCLIRAFATSVPTLTTGLITFRGCLLNVLWTVSEGNMRGLQDEPFNHTLKWTLAAPAPLNVPR